MAEYLSKGTGVTLGTLGTIGFGLSLLNGQQNGGGILGNILGGGGQQMSALQAENAMLRAENYSDKVGKEVYGQSLADNKTLRDEMYAFIKPLSDEAATNRVNVARLEEQMKCIEKTSCLREQIVMGKIGEVALVAQNGITALNGQIACLQQTVAGITKTIVPATAICPAPMPQFNSWTAPTATTSTTTTGA
jgi:hypothetical protein